MHWNFNINYDIIQIIIFVVFHGAYGSNEENWFPYIKEELEYLGQTVLVPQFPSDNWDEAMTVGESFRYKQNLKSWTETFEKEVLPSLDKKEKLCFIGHSLGCVFILHLIEKYKIDLDCAIFVSPFLEKLGKWEFDVPNSTFYKTDFDFEELKKYIPLSYKIHSENDPYVKANLSDNFAKLLESNSIYVKGGKHVSSGANLRELPIVLELCKGRLDLSLYQKYLAHRSELFSLDTTHSKTQEIIMISPNEILNEGKFHFRNLQKGGFCTNLTSLSDFWDPNSVYMQESRKAAKRVPITRVYIYEEKKDLEKKGLQELIQKDIESGTHVYICDRKDIDKSVKELDFGIWDDDYLCVVNSDLKGGINEVLLKHVDAEIKKAKGWQKEILKVSKKVENYEDIK